MIIRRAEWLAQARALELRTKTSREIRSGIATGMSAHAMARAPRVEDEERRRARACA